MNKKIITFLIVLLTSIGTYAQNKSFPTIDVTKLDGTATNTSEIINDGNLKLIIVWATWNKPAIVELNAINEKYADWTSKYGVEIIIISVDDARNKAKVKPFVTGKGWKFTVYQDVANKISSEIENCKIPSTYLINGKGEIVWELNDYEPEDIDKIEAELNKIKK